MAETEWFQTHRLSVTGFGTLLLAVNYENAPTCAELRGQHDNSGEEGPCWEPHRHESSAQVSESCWN